MSREAPNYFCCSAVRVGQSSEMAMRGYFLVALSQLESEAEDERSRRRGMYPESARMGRRGNDEISDGENTLRGRRVKLVHDLQEIQTRMQARLFVLIWPSLEALDPGTRRPVYLQTFKPFKL